MRLIHVRLCPEGRPTIDASLPFLRVPNRGETIIHGAEDRYVVVEIDWQPDGEPFVIAHADSRPRARQMLRGGEL
jgi:hypothetical protein